MERTSKIYKLRRKLQVLAHNILSDEFLSKIYFRIVLNKKLNLKKPKTFNEKIQWMKLYYYPYEEKVIEATDKFTVREYLKNKKLDNILVPLLGVWNNAKDIEWEKLPNKFVLKCSHGCAYNIIVEDKNKLDKKQTVKLLNHWMKEDFGAYNIELHYSKIKEHKIVCEEFLGNDIVDYKFFCFDAVPECVYVSNDLIHDRQAQIGFYKLDGTKMDLKREDYTDFDNVIFPPFFNKMVEISKKLSKDFPFVRVDFFVTNNNYYFAELTFTPSAGMMPFNPEKYDLEWGKKILLKNIWRNFNEKK